MSGERYKNGYHLPRVKKAANVRLAKYIVLSVLCDRSEFDRPEVTITKPQIAEISGLCARSVKTAMKSLRDRGVIEPIKGFAGGSGVPTTYRLCIVGQGDQEQPQEEEKAVKCPPALFSDWHKRLGIAEAMERKARYERGEEITH